MFYFRLNKVKIWNNGSGKKFWITGSDKSKIQFISFVVSESVAMPNLDDIINETDLTKRKALLKEAATEVAGSFIFTPIHNVKDKFEVTFGETGIVVYQSAKIPDSFSWQILCVKLNKDNRDLGEELKTVINDEKFDDFAKSFPVLVGTAVSAPYTAGLEIGKFVFKAFTNHLSKQKDKQLGILQTSYIRLLDYPNGNREAKDVQDSTGNLRIDYSLLGIE